MLDGSADSKREVQFRGDCLSRTSDLAIHRQPTFIADRTRSRYFPAQQVSQFLSHGNIFWRLDPTSHGDKNRRLRQVNSLLSFAEYFQRLCANLPGSKF